MEKLENNPIHLYVGQLCAICDTDQPVQDIIEGCDFVQDLIISERTNYDPSIIKPILRDISDITKKEALEVANIVWFALGNKKIEAVEIKTTPIFPYAAIYFDWCQEQFNPELQPDKFILSLDNDHHTVKLFQIKKLPVYEQLVPMPIYQSHKLTVYLIQKGFNIGILDEGSYLIRNKS